MLSPHIKADVKPNDLMIRRINHVGNNSSKKKKKRKKHNKIGILFTFINDIVNRLAFANAFESICWKKKKRENWVSDSDNNKRVRKGVAPIRIYVCPHMT